MKELRYYKADQKVELLLSMSDMLQEEEESFEKY